MAHEEAAQEIEKDLCGFEYVGEVLATMKHHNIQSVSEAIEHYYSLWEITEGLTDEYVRRKEDENVEINPGSFSQMNVKGRQNRFNIDAVIESLRNQEKYIESILMEFEKHYPKRFPKNDRFRQSMRPTP